VELPWPGWLIGIAFGLVISLPDAVITKAYLPILIGGAIGGTIIRHNLSVTVQERKISLLTLVFCPI
jgi:hypothetical protein